MGKEAVLATLCTDKGQYNRGDTIHITFTMKNLLDEQIVLDSSQKPVMDIGRTFHLEDHCLSQTQAEDQKLVHLVLESGESHTIQWDWLPSNAEIGQIGISSRSNAVGTFASWQGTDGAFRTLEVWFGYGKMQVPVP